MIVLRSKVRALSAPSLVLSGVMVAGGCGCSAYMPNTGIERGKFVEVVAFPSAADYVPTQHPDKIGAGGAGLTTGEESHPNARLASFVSPGSLAAAGVNAAGIGVVGISLGGGLADKVATEAAKLLARLADEALEELQRKFTGVTKAGYPNEQSEDQYQLYLSRGVRIPLKDVHEQIERFRNESPSAIAWGEARRPYLSLDVCEFLVRLAEAGEAEIELSKPGAVDQMKREDRLRHGWYEVPIPGKSDETEKVVQLITTRLACTIKTRKDAQHQNGQQNQQALRVVKPELKVYATEAHVPNMSQVLAEIRQAAKAERERVRTASPPPEAAVSAPTLSLIELEGLQDLKVEKLIAPDENTLKLLHKGWSLLDEQVRKQFSVKLAISATVTSPTTEGPPAQLGDFSGTLQGIWPADTHWDREQGRLKPALDVSLDNFDSLWIAKITDNYNIRLVLTETSNMEQWIGKLREALRTQVEKRGP